MEEGRERKQRREERKESRFRGAPRTGFSFFPLSCLVTFTRSSLTEARRSLPRREALL